MKISNFDSIEDSSDDSLLMVSYTDDGGQTYKTRQIRMADFIDDFEVEDLANVTGTPADTQVLTWDGSVGQWTPSDNLQPGDNVSELVNDSGYLVATDAAVPGYTLLALNNIRVEEGNIGRTVLIVGFVASDFQQNDPGTPKPYEERGCAQITSLGDGNAVLVYENGNDYLAGIASQGPFFMSDGETMVIEVVEPGAIITMSEGGYGYSEQRATLSGGNTYESPMPLLSLGLAFRESFFYAFRNSNQPTGDSRGLVHVVCGPVPSTVKLENPLTGTAILGQENIQLEPFERVTLTTDANSEYKIKGSEPIMACVHAQMGDSPRFYDSRLIMPLTNDGITWPRSGYMSSLYQNCLVKYYVNDGSQGTGNAVPGQFTIAGPGSPVGIQGQGATGSNDPDYNPRSASRFLAQGLVSAFSGADGSGLEATPMMPVSAMSQKVPLCGTIKNELTGRNNCIAIASPYEGVAQIYEFNQTTGELEQRLFVDPATGLDTSDILLERRTGTTYTTQLDQRAPASATIDAAGGNATSGVYEFRPGDPDFTGGVLIANVPVAVVLNNTQNTGTQTNTYRGSSGNQVLGVRSKADETLMVGITPEEIRLNVRLAQDSLYYRQTLQAGGTEAWVRA